MTKQSFPRLLLFLSLLLLPLPAIAAPVLSISSPGGDGVFVLRGDQMSGVAGFDLSVKYDQATLANPRVTFGGLVAGMTSAANPSNPIRIAGASLTAVSSGSGVIATITFDRTGSSPGSITLLAGVLIDTAGKQVAMATPIITNPPPPSSSEEGSGGGENVGNSGGSGGSGGGEGTGETPGPGVSPQGSSGYTGGTLTMPGEGTPGQEGAAGQAVPGDDGAPEQETQGGARIKKATSDDAETQPEREDDTQRAQERGLASTANGKPTPLAEPVKMESVLARFKEFKGERTPANLTALFARPAEPSYTQDPLVVLADGKATVTLNIFINLGDATPRFSFGGCSYVSYSRTEKGWEIQARPDRGAVGASVAVLYNGQRQEFPLVVAPAVQIARTGQKRVTEADFTRFLSDRGTESAPRFDLNKDGKRDYLDDYIYTANYLVKTKQVK